MTKKRLSTWTILWLAWIFAFLGIEIPAALNKRGGDTLSEHIWHWFSVKGKQWMWMWRRVALVVFWILGVGVAHFALEISALWSVILPGIPFGYFLVWSVVHEGSPEETAVGGVMQFSWLKSVKKGLQAVGELVLSAALVAGGDALFTGVDSAEELGQLGIPSVAVLPTLMVVRMAVNWWKVRRAGLVAKSPR